MSAQAPGALLPRPITLSRVERELEDVVTFQCEPAGGLSFQPGQFNMIYLHGLGEVPLSISGDAHDPSRLVHTVRAVGAVTRVMASLTPGSVLGLRGPYGSSWPLDSARGRDVVFVAGGLGLAPLRPAILHVLAERDAYGRVTVLAGARSPETLLFPEDLARWRGRIDCDVRVTVDQAGPGWRGPVGVVTSLFDNVALDPDDAVFVCGPEIMMRFVVRELAQRGVPAASIWLSLERSMKCGVGLCGHCQLGGTFVCKDGPVYRADAAAPLLAVREL